MNLKTIKAPKGKFKRSENAADGWSEMVEGIRKLASFKMMRDWADYLTAITDQEKIVVGSFRHVGFG